MLLDGYKTVKLCSTISCSSLWRYRNSKKEREWLLFISCICLDLRQMSDVPVRCAGNFSVFYDWQLWWYSYITYLIFRWKREMYFWRQENRILSRYELVIQSAGVAPEANLRITLVRKHTKRDPPWLWNPGQTSSEVQNRGISGHTKRTYVIVKI